MAEYIKREAGAELIEKLRYYANTYAIGDNLGREIEGTDELLFEAAEVIEKLIAADVAPVVRGRWEQNDDYDASVCSSCQTMWSNLDNDTQNFNFCPNCGARMEG